MVDANLWISFEEIQEITGWSKSTVNQFQRPKSGILPNLSEKGMVLGKNKYFPRDETIASIKKYSHQKQINLAGNRKNAEIARRAKSD